MNRRQGISLLEIVVAINCTALLMAMLCQALPLARRQTHEAEVRLGGALLASNVLETYLTVAVDEWPQGPFTMPGEWRKVQLLAEPWDGDPRMIKATAIVLIGSQERYRLETLVYNDNH